MTMAIPMEASQKMISVVVMNWTDNKKSPPSGGHKLTK